MHLKTRFATRPFADWFWTGMLLVAVFTILLWADAEQDRWVKLGVSPMSGLFADWAAVLAAGEAWAAGGDPWAVPNLFDPYGRPHVYGPHWLLLGHMGLTTGDSGWSGTILVSAFVIVVARIGQIHDWKTFITWGLATCSAPILLAINRANNDIIIFLLIILAGWGTARREAIFHWLAVFGLIAASLLKFYPAIALIAIMATEGSFRTRILHTTLACVLTAFFVWNQYELIQRSLNAVPSPNGWWAYDGKAALGLLWEIISGKTRPSLLLGSALALPTLGCVLLAAKNWWRFLPPQGAKSFIVVASALCWIGCLFVGSSFIYRAIWLIPVFGLFIVDSTNSLKSRAGSSLIMGSLFLLTTIKQSLLIKYYSFGDIENAGTILLIHGAEQVMLLFTSVTCLIILTGWAYRTLRQSLWLPLLHKNPTTLPDRYV